jgi:hypothetical protein
VNSLIVTWLGDDACAVGAAEVAGVEQLDEDLRRDVAGTGDALDLVETFAAAAVGAARAELLGATKRSCSSASPHTSSVLASTRKATRMASSPAERISG